jgi:aspartokinase
MNALSNHCAAQLDRANARIALYEKRFLKNLELTEELMSHSHQRELESARAESEDARNDRLLSQGEQLMPAIIARITGATAVNDFIHTLPIEKFEMIAKSLDDEQREALFEVLRQAGRGEEAIKRVRGDLLPDEEDKKAATTEAAE